jgi:hypothetical protein
MAFWKFTGAAPEYFSSIGLTAKPGQVYDFGTATPPGENIPKEGTSPTVSSNWTTDPGPASDFLLNGKQASDVAAAPAGSTFTSLRVGGAYQTAFTAEMGQDNDGVVSDLSFVRIRARASRGLTSPSSFFGETALRVEVEDTASVVSAATAPYLYGLRVRVVPRINRTQSGIDDLVGVAVLNRSFGDTGTAFNGTEGVYVGWGGGSTGGASRDWNAGVGIDTVANNGMYIARGPYDYGILMTGTINTAAMRIPNGAPIVARNSTDSANIDVIRADTANNIRLGSGSIHTVVGIPNQDTDVTQPFEVQHAGVTDGTLGRSHARIVDNQAFAAGVGGTIGFAGYVDASTPRTIRTFGAIAGRKTNATSGNASGYLSLYSRGAGGLTEVLRLNELLQVVVTDASDVVLGTTTGTKFGTATTQKLAFWNKTPIVQPTTAVAAATFVAGTGTAVQDVSTFGGYTIAKVVQALQNVGILA